VDSEDQILVYIGVLSLAMALSINVVDAAVAAYEKYALSTPEPEDDVRAARARAAIDAVRDFVDTLMGLLRPFNKRKREKTHEDR